MLLNKQDQSLFRILTHLKLTTISAVLLVAFITDKDPQNNFFAAHYYLPGKKNQLGFANIIAHFRI